jgi:hypothetical protein
LATASGSAAVARSFTFCVGISIASMRENGPVVLG